MKIEHIGMFPALVIVCLGAIMMLATSCKHDGIPANQLEPVNFTEQVLPIFQNSCATSGCHDVNTGESGYVFSDYASIMRGITAGNASKSEAYQAITSTFELMPPNNALTTNERILIRIWIDQGAKP